MKQSIPLQVFSSFLCLVLTTYFLVMMVGHYVHEPLFFLLEFFFAFLFFSSYLVSEVNRHELLLYGEEHKLPKAYTITLIMGNIFFFLLSLLLLLFLVSILEKFYLFSSIFTLPFVFNEVFNWSLYGFWGCRIKKRNLKLKKQPQKPVLQIIDKN